MFAAKIACLTISLTWGLLCVVKFQRGQAIGVFYALVWGASTATYLMLQFD